MPHSIILYISTNHIYLLIIYVAPARAFKWGFSVASAAIAAAIAATATRKPQLSSRLTSNNALIINKHTFLLL